MATKAASRMRRWITPVFGQVNTKRRIILNIVDRQKNYLGNRCKLLLSVSVCMANDTIVTIYHLRRTSGPGIVKNVKHELYDEVPSVLLR